MRKYNFWSYSLAALMLLAAILLIFQNNKNSKAFEIEAFDPDAGEGGILLQDRMDLVWKQEFARTKDPATGDVPRERLLVAHADLLKKQALMKQMKIEGSLSGLSWTERGPNNQGGRTRTILVDANDATKKTVWVGSVGGGLWKTTDVTQSSPSWTAVNNFFSNLSITTIAQDPSNTQIMYFGTGEGYLNQDAIKGMGIWKSTDGGTTWAQLSGTNNSNFNYIKKIVVTSGGIILAATNTGLRRSTDGGTNWTKVLGNGTVAGAVSNTTYDVEIASDGSVYASLRGSIHKSTDNGATYSSALSIPSFTSTTRIEIAVAKSDANYVYAIAVATSGSYSYAIGGIIKSTDAGSTWSTVTLPTDGGSATPDFGNNQAWYSLAIDVDPNDKNTVCVGGLNLFKSTDGGSSWTQLSHWYGGFGYQYVHADQHIIYYEPGSSANIYFGNDGGIFRTTTGTSLVPTISSRGNNYNTTQFYSCAIHPTSGSNDFLAGAQDNGTHRFSSAGLGSTAQPIGGDGAFCHIDQDNPIYQFGQYVYNNHYRSTNTGGNFSSMSGSSFGNTGQFINPSDYDNTGNDLYAGHDAGNYFLWADAPTSSTSTSVSISQFSGGQVTAVTCSEITSGTVWFGLDNGKVVRVDNATSASPTATDLSTGLPSSFYSVSCIAEDPNDINHLLVTYSNYGVTSVWETTNGGTSWTSVEGDLSDMPVWWAMFNPYNTTQALLATELGVYSTDNLNGTSTTWLPNNSGLANVRVYMLQYRKSDYTMIAATHGRGLYSTVIPNPTPVTLGGFTGVFNGNNVNLSWLTYSEQNNRGFEIERSNDGINFQTVGFVQGKGNSSVINNYSFLDPKLSEKLYYYKLKQIDNNNGFTYSSVITVKAREDKFIISNLYPNPVSDALSITFAGVKDRQVQIIVIDMSGHFVLEKNINNVEEQLTLDVSNLSSVVYTIIATSGGTSAYSKFRKL